MSTDQVAQKLVSLCKEGKFAEAIDSLYSHDIVSVEAVAGPDGSREMKGLEAVKGKTKWWEENHIVHDSKVEGPLVAGHHFAVRFHMDVTFKPTGARHQMDELGVYHVKDGKVVHEQFFYNA